MARKILLADDSVTAQNMGRKILADAGYEVITVNNGSAALKKISELKPDLIVLDVYMPGYSGLEVCQRIKEVGESSRIPVLLTVGKLEPFKPDEAKRVRADGFIVKPFEASELLSALSKLEDKIVPRTETSKSGRFARATASIEDSRYDRTVAVEEDSGWKNRIAFPSKKNEKGPQEDVDEAALYNPVNKDLRTIIEPKAVETPRAEKAEARKGEEARVDLSALTAAGLPKDVTAEEIAALAAAVAQVQGKVVGEQIAAPAPEHAAAPAVEVAPQKPEKKEKEEETVLEATATAAAATSGEEKPQEPIEAKEADSAIVASPADVMAAIAGLEPGNAAGASSGNGSWSDGTSHGSPQLAADEPVTMALAALGDSCVASRWTATSVPLAPEDAAISLEHEMQKAYAAFAAAETGHAESVPASIDSAPNSAAVIGSPVERDVSESATSVPATVAPEAARALRAVASAATNAVSAAIQELEVVAASYLEPKATGDPCPAAGEAETAEVAPPAAAAVHEDREREESQAPVVDAALSAANEVPGDQDSVSQAASDMRAVALGEPSAQGKAETAIHESDRPATTAATWKSWQPVGEPADPSPAHPAELAPAEPSLSTAAHSSPAPSTPPDAAAMAVAGGAESSPENVPAASEDSGEIASIVDSVLADLRPRIVEEISRKLGKKK